MKCFLLIICASFLVVQVFSQQKAIALKFDEFNDSQQLSYTELQQTSKERIERFVNQLKRERGSRVYLIHYRARVFEDSRYFRPSTWTSNTKWAISGSSVKSEDIFIVDGGIREFDTIEFWIAPKGAEPPNPTPTFNRSEAIDCPSIYAYQDGINFNKNYPIYFKASSRPQGADAYNWTVTDGKIVGDNGRSLLELDVSNAKTDRVTAFVEIEGLPLPCKNTAFAIAEFGNTPRLVDEFGRIANGDLKARLDHFFTLLQNHPEKQGFAYIYGGRDVGSRDAESRKRLIAQYVLFRRFDETRIKIISVGFRDEVSTEFWLVPAAISAPVPTPTVDKRFIQPNVRKRQVRKLQ